MSETPVIYIEDNPDDAFFMKLAFAEAGVRHPLTVLSDGQEGMDYLLGHGQYANRSKYPLPCLLLLDLNIPVRTGFELLRWIRSQPGLKSLKVVIVSSSNLDLDIRIADELEVIDYLVKPSTPSHLTAYIMEGIGRWLA